MNIDTRNTFQPGSPQWWSTQPRERNSSSGRGRPSISFEKIIATALEIVNSAGPQALNMRVLADRLNSGTATLYRHFESKDEILAYVVDRFLGLLLEHKRDLSNLDWRGACFVTATDFYHQLSACPHIIPLLSSQIPVGPNALTLREAWLSMLLDAGFPPSMAASVYTTIAHYVLGFASQLSAGGRISQDTSHHLSQFFDRLDPALYPSTVKIAPQLSNISIDDEFSFGMKLIIHGLDYELNQAKLA
ncbi:TetR/AcrR family transcriptional regulator [Pseudomonas sp. SO81]|jgi:AcrR family transcriptional regulator|uniref:TetR/AcrR family transcriptional regulator n=1 Tax=Pseudomonas sp. SO81 TaxID=2983246 RepID=UPI00338EC678